METIVKCPICNHRANYSSSNGPMGIEEEYVNCSTCGYRSEFAYGGYIEVVGSKWFVWSYTISSNEFALVNRRISRARFMAKRNWKKFRRRTFAKDCPI